MSLLKGVIFDMDGTLTLPHQIDFKRMRQRVGIATGDILAAIRQMPEKQREEAMSAIDDEERRGLADLKLQPGVDELLASLSDQGMRCALVTRNSQVAVDLFLARVPVAAGVLNPIMTRDSCHVKPDPQTFKYICDGWGLHPSETIVIGDSFADDIQAGQKAGCHTCLITNESNLHLASRSGYSVADLRELPSIFQRLGQESPIKH